MKLSQSLREKLLEQGIELPRRVRTKSVELSDVIGEEIHVARDDGTLVETLRVYQEDDLSRYELLRRKPEGILSHLVQQDAHLYKVEGEDIFILEAQLVPSLVYTPQGIVVVSENLPSFVSPAYQERDAFLEQFEQESSLLHKGKTAQNRRRLRAHANIYDTGAQVHAPSYRPPRPTSIYDVGTPRFRKKR